MFKTCCSCKVALPEEMFSWRSKPAQIRARECKSCHAKTRKENYEKNKQRNFGYVYKRRKQLAEWLKKYKATLQCERCGENHPATLDFHHRDPNEKEIEISMAINAKGWSLERMKQEIDKCEVLCANCHRKEHWRV